MLSLKGGVGKTTMTTTLGSTFASLRGDRVIAVDANPDRGTLSQKIPLETTATVRHLLRDANRVRRYSDVRAYTSQGPSRLEVLASEQDPAVSEAFSEVDYRRTVTLLEHFYNVVLTDCGTGLMHSAMKGVLDVADSLLIVSSASIDGARSASATLDWLDAHGYRDLVSRSVAVINYVRRSSGNVDLDRVADHFAARCRAVVRLPFDPHLEEGAEIELDKLAPRTRAALLELAATVADDFGRAGSRVRRPMIPGSGTPTDATRGAPADRDAPRGRSCLRWRAGPRAGALDPLVERAQELRVVVGRDRALRATRRGAGGWGRSARPRPCRRDRRRVRPPGPPGRPSPSTATSPRRPGQARPRGSGSLGRLPASSTSPAADAPRTGHHHATGRTGSPRDVREVDVG